MATRKEPSQFSRANRSLAVLVGLLTVLGIGVTLLSAFYMTRSDASHIHGLMEKACNEHRQIDGHKVMVERVNTIRVEQKKLGRNVSAMHADVIRIGERLNVRGLTGSD